MICKNCGKEMPEVGAFCPFCATPKENITAEEPAQLLQEETAVLEELAEVMEQTEQPEEAAEVTEQTEQPEKAPAKKIKPWQLGVIVFGGVLLIGLLAGVILYSLGILQFRSKDFYANESYTSSTYDLQRNRVVAKIGDKKLTNSELMIYYQNDVYTFLNQYYSYLSMFGLDLTLPLEDQTFPMPMDGVEEQTWQQFFLNNSIATWQQYAILETLAEQEGFRPDDATQQQIDTIEANAEATALAYGFASAEEWLESQMGMKISMEDYVRFNTTYFYGTAYLNSFYTDKYPTADEIAAFYTENEATLNAGGISKDLGLNAVVRHILIAPQGGTADETGVTIYSDEEWAAALDEAEQLLAQWKAGEATEESFTALAVEHSDDPGVTSNSGLYEDIHINASYLEEFKTWAIEETNKPGDTGIVKTTAGYHIMYFVEGEEYYLQLAGEQLVAERIQKMLEDAMVAYPMEVNYKKIALKELNLSL